MLSTWALRGSTWALGRAWMRRSEAIMYVTMTGAARQGYMASMPLHTGMGQTWRAMPLLARDRDGWPACHYQDGACRDGEADSIAEFSPPRPKQQHNSE